jgi:hypothetical protein
MNVSELLNTTPSRKSPAKFNARARHIVAGNQAPMQTYEMQLGADQIVEETSDWPEGAVADLVDRILRAKYGEVDPSVDRAWHDETQHRIADMESGKVQGVPLDDMLAKARKITGQ